MLPKIAFAVKGNSNRRRSTYKQNNKMLAVGIDLGTSNSSVGFYDVVNNCPNIFKDLNTSSGNNNRQTPSIVCFVDGHFYCGYQAKQNEKDDPKNTVSYTKRFIGMHIDDFDSTRLQRFCESMTYEIDITGEEPIVILNEDDPELRREYKSEDFAARILDHLKKNVDRYKDENGYSKLKVVITYPVYFLPAQVEATRRAAESIGFAGITMLTEPEAAAYYYLNCELNNLPENEYTIRHFLVYDLGGGTFDLCHIEVEFQQGRDANVIVRSSGGDTFLGGLDFDQYITRKLNEQLMRNRGARFNVFAPGNEYLRCCLREAAKDLKEQLTEKTAANIWLARDYFGDGRGAQLRLTRTEFEEYCRPLLDSQKSIVKEFLCDSGVPVNEFTVLMVGGSSRVPILRDELIRLGFLQENIKICENPDEAVVLGATIHAAKIKSADDEELKEKMNQKYGNQNILRRIGLPLGIRVVKDPDQKSKDLLEVLIPAGTEYPFPARDIDHYYEPIPGRKDLIVEILEKPGSCAEEDEVAAEKCKQLGQFHVGNLTAPENKTPLVKLMLAMDQDRLIRMTVIDGHTGQELKQYSLDYKPMRQIRGIIDNDSEQAKDAAPKNTQKTNKDKEEEAKKRTLKNECVALMGHLESLKFPSNIPPFSLDNMRGIHHQLMEMCSNREYPYDHILPFANKFRQQAECFACKHAAVDLAKKAEKIVCKNRIGLVYGRPFPRYFNVEDLYNKFITDIEPQETKKAVLQLYDQFKNDILSKMDYIKNFDDHDKLLTYLNHKF